ncbi:EKC/KEOPS complex, subunit Gon7 [Exophiala viscosa]|uniref:EKC/KEOPS complex, subunit Gon7 n=1 Tax=Exophiala viscosa TaxID=2486360 RepID=UPI00218FE392|nr:EKC/KEOPS complex, subunit Gon7 [Exophiala viscosa]
MPGLNDSSAVLRAEYQSPTGSKDFQHAISAPASQDTKPLDTRAKTKYLSDLRASSRKLQEDINKFLTEKMEEDKKAQGQVTTKGTSNQKAEEELEEETYGEEAPEDDS